MVDVFCVAVEKYCKAVSKFNFHSLKKKFHQYASGIYSIATLAVCENLDFNCLIWVVWRLAVSLVNILLEVF